MEQTGIYNVLIALFIGVIVFLLIVRFAFRLDSLKKDIKYVNMEIRRTRGSERKAWQRENAACGFPLFRFIEDKKINLFRQLKGINALRATNNNYLSTLILFFTAGGLCLSVAENQTLNGMRDDVGIVPYKGKLNMRRGR